MLTIEETSQACVNSISVTLNVTINKANEETMRLISD